jgi:Flp pilus assembly protein TadD
MKIFPASFRMLALALSVPALVPSLLAGCASQGSFNPRPVVSQRGADPMSDLRVAESALSAADTELATTLFEKVLKANPQSLPAQIGLGDAMYQGGDLARAGVLYGQAAAAAPDDPRAQLGLARVALRERRLDDAASRYRQLVSAYPDNAVAAEGLGVVLDLQGRHADAQAVYRAALRQHPEAQGLKTNLGLSLILAKRAREGANVLLDIAALPNAPVQARENLALAYGLLGNADAAKRILLGNMPAASAEDNLRFYQSVRGKLMAGQADGVARVGVVPADSGVSDGVLK